MFLRKKAVIIILTVVVVIALMPIAYQQYHQRAQLDAAAKNPSYNTTLLSKAIYSEARGEPYVGQVAVGGVIMNRIKHPGFPKTIAGVIFQPGAFSAVSDGQFYLPPNPTAVKAAVDAISGWDPSSGAIYYYNPSKAVSAWIRKRPVITRIGKHLFCR